MRVKLRKVGNSLSVTIPYAVVDELCLQEGMELDVVAREDTIVLETFTSRWERMCAPLREQARTAGLTPTDIERVVREVRAEGRSGGATK